MVNNFSVLDLENALVVTMDVDLKTFEKHPHLVETPSHLRPGGPVKSSRL